jgi:DNA/RNA endonuclease G (NUC1)
MSRSVTRVVVVITAFALLLPVFRASAIIDAALQMQLGNPSNATTDPSNTNHYLIQRTVEAIDFNDSRGEPNWASWDLTAGDIGSSGRSSTFYTDTTLPQAFYQVAPSDYIGSGFDRGHMCPSGDRTDNTMDNDLVFYMSNIIPQASSNNQGVWENFESYCRSLAQAGNELLIICGPSGFDGSRIPSGAAAIPQNTWKIAVVVPLGAGTALQRITTATRVIAIKIPNNNSVSAVWQDYVTSVNQIQNDTGFTFFTALSDRVAAVLRSKVDGQSKPLPTITGFAPMSGGINDSVVITGTNFASTSAVTFHSVGASFTISSDTRIVAIVPTNATTGFIGITTAGNTTTSSASFIVTNSTTTGGGIAYTGILAGWDVSGQTGFGSSPLAPTTNAPNLTLTGLTRGSGVGTSGTAAAMAWGGSGFMDTSSAAATAANHFAAFSVTATSGYSLSCSSISRFDYRRSSTGPTSGELQYQVGSGTFVYIASLTYSVSSSSGSSLGPIDLSGISALQNVAPGVTVTFRIVNYGGTSSGGTWYVFDVANSAAPDLIIEGQVAPVAQLTPIQMWRQQWFATTNNAGFAADTFVNSSDQMPNLLKYALGLNPLVAANNPVVGDIHNDFLRLTAPKNPNATDISIAAVVSGELLTWTTNGTVIDQNTPTMLQVHDQTPVATGTNRFIRLRVSDP